MITTIIRFGLRPITFGGLMEVRKVPFFVVGGFSATSFGDLSIVEVKSIVYLLIGFLNRRFGLVCLNHWLSFPCI